MSSSHPPSSDPRLRWKKRKKRLKVWNCSGGGGGGVGRFQIQYLQFADSSNQVICMGFKRMFKTVRPPAPSKIYHPTYSMTPNIV